jgi:hypothetical protein
MTATIITDHNGRKHITNEPLLHPPQRTEQEPVIDKSAAIRIATALGWEPKRTWVGLTDEEIVFINEQHYNIAFRDFDADVAIARAIEAKLRSKNEHRG